jgi:hypothetical protein
MPMAKFIHEIWEVIDASGQVLPSLGLAGPDGDDLRKILCEEAAQNGQAAPHDRKLEQIKNILASL